MNLFGTYLTHGSYGILTHVPSKQLLKADLSSRPFDRLDEGGSEALVSFVNGLPDGTTVMVGARDEASISLSAEAKMAIKSLGATRIDELAFRGGYALVGRKGGSALSETGMCWGMGGGDRESLDGE